MKAARAVLAFAAAMGLAGALAGAPQLDAARAGPCVDEPQAMRRGHMEMLRHGRDETVRRGVRDGKSSLAGCVDCHASLVDGRVVGSDRHFCQGCHSYAAVKLDCFECHASRAREGRLRTAGRP